MKFTEDDLPFLQSGTAHKLRAHLASMKKVQLEALINAAMDSTDPKVRGIATSLATLANLQKDLQYNDPE